MPIRTRGNSCGNPSRHTLHNSIERHKTNAMDGDLVAKGCDNRPYTIVAAVDTTHKKHL
jgi:hypothetical protein